MLLNSLGEITRAGENRKVRLLRESYPSLTEAEAQRIFETPPITEAEVVDLFNTQWDTKVVETETPGNCEINIRSKVLELIKEKLSKVINGEDAIIDYLESKGKTIEEFTFEDLADLIRKELQSNETVKEIKEISLNEYLDEASRINSQDFTRRTELGTNASVGDPIRFVNENGYGEQTTTIEGKSVGSQITTVEGGGRVAGNVVPETITLRGGAEVLSGAKTTNLESLWRDVRTNILNKDGRQLYEVADVGYEAGGEYTREFKNVRFSSEMTEVPWHRGPLDSRAEYAMTNDTVVRSARVGNNVRGRLLLESVPINETFEALDKNINRRIDTLARDVSTEIKIQAEFDPLTDEIVETFEKRIKEFRADNAYTTEGRDR